MKKITLCSMLACFSCFLSAQSVEVDPTFGADGVVETGLVSWALNNAFGTIVNLLPDGKIIVGGTRDEIFTIERYFNSGTKDTTFLSLPSSLGSLTYGTAIQQDGKILATAPHTGTPHIHKVIRFESNGAIDSTFGNNGIVSTQVGNFFASNLFVQADGKIVVYGGLQSSISNYPIVVTRLNPNGAFDSTFAMNGQLVLSLSQDLDIPQAGMEMPDGKLLFTGLSGSRIFLLRLESNGSPDTSFGTNGASVDKLMGYGWAFAFAVQPDGKIVVAGTHTTLNSAIITRYHPDGSTDVDFGVQGVVYIQEAYKGVGVAILPNGKIIAVLRGIENAQQVVLAQLLPNGERDPSFGTSGLFIPGINHRVRNLIMSGNQVYVSAQTDAPTPHVSILRFILDLNVGTVNPNNQPDNTLWLYPNPIASQFTFEFGLSQKEHVSIRLYDMQGKLIQSFAHDQAFEQGEHKLSLSCADYLAAGTYVLTLEVAGKKMSSVQVTKQ